MNRSERMAVIWRALWGQPEPLIERAKEERDRQCRRAETLGSAAIHETISGVVKGFGD